MTPTVVTTPSELPPLCLRWIAAPTFEAALDEYQRRHGEPRACWQYRQYFCFEEEK